MGQFSMEILGCAGSVLSGNQHRGLQRTWAIWIAKGLILLPVDPTKAKKRPKKPSYWPSRPIQSRNTPSRKKKEPVDSEDSGHG